MALAGPGALSLARRPLNYESTAIWGVGKKPMVFPELGLTPPGALITVPVPRNTHVSEYHRTG